MSLVSLELHTRPGMAQAVRQMFLALELEKVEMQQTVLVPLDVSQALTEGSELPGQQNLHKSQQEESKAPSQSSGRSSQYWRQES